MVIDDLDINRSAVHPAEAHAELAVDPDAPLTGAITLQGLQAVSGRHAEVLDTLGRRQLLKLSQRDALETREPRNAPPGKPRAESVIPSALRRTSTRAARPAA